MLKNLRQHIGAGGDRDAWQFLLQDGFHPPFVGAVHEGVHKADRDRRDAALAQDAGDIPGARFVERDHNAPLGVHPLGYRKPVATRDVWPGDVLVGVPEIFLVGAADFDHVAKSLGADHRRTRQAAGDQRVGRDGGAVGEQRHVGQIDVFLCETREKALDWVFAGRGLGDAHHPRGLVEQTEVSESATDIDGYTQAHLAYPMLSRALLAR